MADADSFCMAPHVAAKNLLAWIDGELQLEDDQEAHIAACELCISSLRLIIAILRVSACEGAEKARSTTASGSVGPDSEQAPSH
jgi:hypothetical protein